MTRTNILEEIRTWLDDNNYELDIDYIIENAEDEDGNHIELTLEEIDEIENMIYDHEAEVEEDYFNRDYIRQPMIARAKDWSDWNVA